jgi:hypothetical protein
VAKCCYCTNVAEVGRSRCRVCREVETGRYRQAVLEGLCTRCRKVRALENRRMCGGCMKLSTGYGRQYRQAKLSRGLCTSCRSPVEPRSAHKCEACREKRRARYYMQEKPARESSRG